MIFSNFSSPKKKQFSGNNILWVTPKKNNKILKFSASLLFLPIAFHESPFGRTSVGCHLAWKIGFDVPVGPAWSKCTSYIDTYEKKKLVFFNLDILHGYEYIYMYNLINTCTYTLSCQYLVIHIRYQNWNKYNNWN